MNNTSFPLVREAEKTFTAFAGCDIVAFMGNQRIATLQGITYSVTREVMPIFVMGDPNAQTFNKGKRAIAGNLVFTQFDRHAILKMNNLYRNKSVLGDLEHFKNADVNFGNSDFLQRKFNTLNFSDGSTQGDDYRRILEQELRYTNSLIANRAFGYSDQVPPFDITITMVNEMGDSAYMGIHGVQLVNEGGGYTLDDLNTEVAFTFVARKITPLDNLIQDRVTSDPGYVGTY